MQHFSPILLSRARYSPSLDGNVRLALREKELNAHIRLATIIIATLALLLNLYLISFPPSQSLNTSSNDIIEGGLGAKESAAKSSLLHYVANKDTDTNSILRFFDISRLDIEKAELTNICPTCASSDDKVVLSRIPSKNTRSITINNIQYYYQKFMYAYPNTRSLPALKISQNKFILLNSGNIIFKPNNKVTVYEKLIDNQGQITKKDSRPDPSSKLIKKLTLTNDSPIAINRASLTIVEDSEHIELSDYTKKPTSLSSGSNKITLTWDKLRSHESVDITISYKLDQQKLSWCSQIITTALEVNRSEASNCTHSPYDSQPTQYNKEADGFKDIVSSIEAKSPTKDQTVDKAEPNDEVIYQLAFSNPTDQDVVGFKPENLNMTDILEYANITDITGGKSNGTEIQWDSINIGAKQTTYLTVAIKVLSMIPNTNQPESNPASYDCVMSGSYGDEVVNINLPCSAYKQVEQQTFTNRNTGPTISLLVVAAIAGISLALYYFDTMDIYLLNNLRDGKDN